MVLLDKAADVGGIDAIMFRYSFAKYGDLELNRAIDWLKSQGIDSLILTGDFHLATQMVGADTSEFYPALEDAEAGMRVAGPWTKTARPRGTYSRPSRRATSGNTPWAFQARLPCRSWPRATTSMS